LVGAQQAATLEHMQVGRIVLEITQASGESGLRVPSELTMLGKTLLNLDLVGRTLDPQFDPNASIRRNGAKMLQERLWKALSPGNLFGGILELKDLLMRLPGRVNQILDVVARNDLKVKVDAIDEIVLIEGMQKVANRITVGLILAALIIGAALLMRIETSFHLFGYPGLAILCFMGVRRRRPDPHHQYPVERSLFKEVSAVPATTAPTAPDSTGPVNWLRRQYRSSSCDCASSPCDTHQYWP
jgi:ubiquinone biosynthesis protein